LRLTLWPVIFLLALMSCEPEQDFTPIPDHPGEPEEDPGPVPPEVYLETALDTWEQEEGPTNLDIIALVDQSCSMSHADDAAVSQALKQIIEDVELSMSPTGKWTLTLGTTSPTQVGPLQQFTRPPSADLPQTLLDIGLAVENIPGGVAEHGLYAAWDFQNTGLGLDTTPNKLIITVSDEDDQSSPPLATHNAEGDVDLNGDGSPNIYVRFWDPVEFAAWAASEPATDVIYIAPGDYRGRRYQKAAALHGRFIDFNSDWSGALASLTWVTVLDDTLELSHDPVPGTLRVAFDGTYTSDWNLTGRTLFLPNPPPIGTAVTASYEYWTF
jgi:hypothetical protein